MYHWKLKLEKSICSRFGIGVSLYSDETIENVTKNTLFDNRIENLNSAIRICISNWEWYVFEKNV